MPRSYHYVVARLSVGWLVFSMLCMGSVAPGYLWAQSVSSSPELIQTETMTLDGKTEDAVFCVERPFRVTETTTIIDAYGTRITLDALLLPATAEVRYELIMDQDPVVLRIVVK